jgi:hypothetical protein
MSVSSVGRPEAARKRYLAKSLRNEEPSLKNILLCKKAYIDDAGHNIYESEFKTILATKTPAVEPEVFIVTRWGDGAGRDFQQEIRIFAPAGSLQVFNSGEFEKKFDLGNLYHEHMVFGRVSGLLLPREGRYRIEVYLNGELKGKTYFNVVLCKKEEAAFSPSEEPAKWAAKVPERFPFSIPIPSLAPFKLPLNCFFFSKD